jgi:hypothetical protein
MKTTKPASVLWASFAKGGASLVLALGLMGASTPSSLAADPAMEDLLGLLRQRGSITEAEFQRMSAKSSAGSAQKFLTKDDLKKEWFGKMSIRGYVQTRYTHVFEADEAAAKSFGTLNDPSVQRRDQLIVRRGRMIFSGDMHDHLYLYAQIDYQAGVATGYSETANSGLQTRDLYADISFDQDKEHRLRLGISKTPYGFVNLQSSQNRLSMERPDALNTAVEGERDLGAYYMWADKEARRRFKDLVASGLKGSGDYGVITLGINNGQGLNRYDSNRNPHVVARLAYPFQLESGQYFELGLSGYHGQFVPGGAQSSAPKSARAFDDTRAAANFVWYPQPFGIEAEWTIGRGPETEISFNETTGRGTNSAAGVTSQNLQGGYVLANYKMDTSAGVVIPFTRWQYFDGARKFVIGAPTQKINEVDFGIEYQPWSCFEVALIYTHAFERTSSNATTSTNFLTKENDRLSIQGQFNF